MFAAVMGREGKKEDMDIAVFGLGYVGAESAAWLSKAEHTVVPRRKTPSSASISRRATWR
jgi:glycine/D-amino acid oxidase-like deaminating enzyme